MKRMLIAIAVVWCGCSKEAREPAPPPPVTINVHHDEPSHEGLPRSVHLTPEVVAGSGITTMPAKRAVLTETLELPGELVADPDSSADVAVVVTGRISKVAFKEGSRVKQGDELVAIDVPEVGRLAGELATAQTKAKAARANAQRLDTLAQKGLAAKQEVTNATAEADALEAVSDALAGQLRALGAHADAASRLVIRAPISGVVLSRHAVVGQPIGANEIVATIADLDHVWFAARVFEKDLGNLREGAKAEVHLNAYPKESFVGTVDYIGRQVDPAARTVTARIVLQNRGGLLRIGLFGVARVQIGPGDVARESIVVPRTALTDIAGKTVVFVREPDGDFEMHEITVGESGVGDVAVLSGIREGEPVVVSGVFTLKSIVLKSTLDEREGN